MNEISNQQKSSMAEIFIHFMSFILLGIIATSTGILYFQVINRYFPDILSTTYQNFQASIYSASVINYSIASLIIGFPIFLWAIWFWFRSFQNLPEKKESKLSKWLTYIVLLIAGGTIIGDLITVVYNFLQGEYSSRFFLKALAILIIAGVIFGFYFFERKKNQYKKEAPSNFFSSVGFFSALLVISAIILGFVAGGTPFEARQRNFDFQRTSALQELSTCVGSFAYDNERLPQSLDELKSNTRYGYCASIADSETQKPYNYKVVSLTEFELCGEFTLSNLNEAQNIGYYGKWEKHDKGRMCETQSVTFGKQPLPLEKTVPIPAR